MTTIRKKWRDLPVFGRQIRREMSQNGEIKTIFGGKKIYSNLALLY